MQKVPRPYRWGLDLAFRYQYVYRHRETWNQKSPSSAEVVKVGKGRRVVPTIFWVRHADTVSWQALVAATPGSRSSSRTCKRCRFHVCSSTRETIPFAFGRTWRSTSQPLRRIHFWPWRSCSVDLTAASSISGATIPLETA
ncbi:unnamed protein product [Durusdinium trenchii]|uniref:Uncharacterized protein n=1 Tax=Durusdinium trenchii TaxID=1381693 RepID=A0ABP0J874_9DINO